MQINLAIGNGLWWYGVMTTTLIIENEGQPCELEIKRETAKAYLLRGQCSEAWFPKAAIVDGKLADWFLPNLTLSHGFCLTHPQK
jgi:hypothetical protein